MFCFNDLFVAWFCSHEFDMRFQYVSVMILIWVEIVIFIWVKAVISVFRLFWNCLETISDFYQNRMKTISKLSKLYRKHIKTIIKPFQKPTPRVSKGCFCSLEPPKSCVPQYRNHIKILFQIQSLSKNILTYQHRLNSKEIFREFGFLEGF